MKYLLRMKYKEESVSVDWSNKGVSSKFWWGYCRQQIPEYGHCECNNQDGHAGLNDKVYDDNNMQITYSIFWEGDWMWEISEGGLRAK